MKTIKAYRESLGYTQKHLAEQTGLSLRTIQRVETGKTSPKGHTLQMLAEALGVETAVLHRSPETAEPTESPGLLSSKLINLSVLSFFVLPLGNIILPLIIWRKRRASGAVDEMARKIINFQVIWTLLLFLLLSLSPFIQAALNSSFPLILLVLAGGLVLNLFVVVRTAHAIQEGRTDFLRLPIRLL